MGHLTRTYDWTQTSLGTPDTWPQSLRTTLSILLNSKFPMFLFWGDELLCFYNDAYRPSLGREGKHPTALGKPGARVWPEIWPVIKPMIDQVLAGGEASWSEDQLIPIYRNGTVEDVYWTFSHSPVCDESGKPAGVFVTCAETTAQVTTINKLQVSEQLLQNIVSDASSVGIIVLSGEAMQVSLVNDAYARLIDRHCEELLDKPLFSIIPEAEAVFRPIIDSVRQTGEPLPLYGQPYQVRNAEGETISGFLDSVYQPYKEKDGTITGVMVICQDVTERKQTEQALSESETRFQMMAEDSDILIAMTNENGYSTYLNKAWKKLTGRSVTDLANLGWVDLVHPDDRVAFSDIYQSSLKEHKSFTGEFRILNPQGEYRWLLIKCPARFRPDGSFAGYISSCVDITERKQAEESLRASEAKLQSVIDTAPVAIGLLMGRDLVIELHNQTFIDIVGKGNDIAGKPLREVMPELLTQNQPFLQILDDVFISGKPFQSYGALVQIVQQGVMTNNYYNITYTPLFNEAGEVYAILDIAVDVTEQVLAQQKAEEAEAGLRGAVELAQLGTWSIDVATNGLSYSNRLIEWFGYDPKEQAYREVIPILLEEDRERVETAVAWALNPASDGVYNEIYTIIHPVTGKKRILHAQGKTVFDATGKAIRMNGTAQEITIQRELQLTLENEVSKRTQQLQASVNDLERSNLNLQQFAYVASHDLQEPLRKIQSFGDMLRNRYGEQLGDSGTDFLSRMQASANRMSVLIKDLLTFSRISTQQDTRDPVSLGGVIGLVMSDLDLSIQETNAMVDVDPLPTVQGDKSQLGQLFQNLLNNSIKFRKPNQPPRISITCQTVAVTDLPPIVKPTRQATTYYCIAVADNGIGFDEQYVDRIFQVFQRLHGKNKYAGTGIGLAICEKVVANHGGAIVATSKPGQGATFTVYLPT